MLRQWVSGIRDCKGWWKLDPNSPSFEVFRSENQFIVCSVLISLPFLSTIPFQLGLHASLTVCARFDIVVATPGAIYVNEKSNSYDGIIGHLKLFTVITYNQEVSCKLALGTISSHKCYMGVARDPQMQVEGESMH